MPNRFFIWYNKILVHFQKKRKFYNRRIKILQKKNSEDKSPYEWYYPCPAGPRFIFENTADLDQLASNEAIWLGSTLLSTLKILLNLRKMATQK